jgi:hypothetical protein
MNQSPQSASSSAPARPEPVADPGSRGAAEQFLESLQERVYGAVGLTAEDCQQRELIGQQTILPARLQQKAEQLSPAEFARYREAVLDALTRDELLPRPTAFERPHQYSILHGLKGSIEEAASELSIDLPFVPVIGTLPTRLLEPLMVRVPGTDEVVLLVDGSLLTYVHLLAKVVAHALPPEMLDGDSFVPQLPASDWDELIDPSGAATERFVQLMVATLNGSPASAPSYTPDPVCEQTIAALCECMELFIIGREYARICEGDHLAAASERRAAFGQTFDALVWTGEQEERADALGLGLMLAAANAKGDAPGLAFWAADLLLASFGILDRALMLLESPVAHPLVSLPPTVFDERRRWLRRLMHRLDDGGHAVTFAASLEPVIQTLAERFDVVWQDMRMGPRPRH